MTIFVTIILSFLAVSQSSQIAGPGTKHLFVRSVTDLVNHIATQPRYVQEEAHLRTYYELVWKNMLDSLIPENVKLGGYTGRCAEGEIRNHPVSALITNYEDIHNYTNNGLEIDRYWTFIPLGPRCCSTIRAKDVMWLRLRDCKPKERLMLINYFQNTSYD